MSECVVRMEMPQGCGSCSIANFGYCSINHKPVADPLMGYPENRPANCPIVCQLPEGHGRLVVMRDIDLMMENASSTSDESGLYSLVYRDDLDFDELPTIVPAERSET